MRERRNSSPPSGRTGVVERILALRNDDPARVPSRPGPHLTGPAAELYGWLLRQPLRHRSRPFFPPKESEDDCDMASRLGRDAGGRRLFDVREGPAR
jgi:hypothetical protein